MSLIIANIIGFIVAKWRWFAGAATLLFVALVVGSIYRSCNKPPKLDQEQTIKAQQAIAANDRREMIEVLAESTVAEQGIDNSIKLAEEVAEQAKKDYSRLSNEELAAELERRLNGE